MSYNKVVFYCCTDHRYIGETALDLRSHPGGVMLHLERSQTSSVSRLVVSRARLEDGADYTCSPAGGNNDTVTVSVMVGQFSHHSHHSQAQHEALSQGGTMAAALLIISLLSQ